ncbi:LptA/OstA family protein [Veillonella caviae]|uniref:LptA/OstA family protein n=1 Tax=Veillonella caviae TaxID=248316 RepID=UPI002356FFAB|nr:LptA/OstA family protein [Veillonella caviae]
MNKKQRIGISLIIGLMTLSVTAWAANNDPLTISADTLSYDGNSGRADAKGNVVITQQDKTITGATGWYNTKTREAQLEGGVSMIGTDMAMSAQTVHSVNDSHFKATGAVHLQRQDRQIFGESVEYNTDTEYGKVTGNARLIAEGTTLTGNEVEGWLKEIRAIAQGNVTFTNPERNVSGTGDRATYTQTPNQNDGVVVLSGNAHAVQNGNVLNAPELKISLADDSAETLGGRSTLVIAPNQ